MSEITTIDEVRERLKRMSPEQVREVVRLGNLHAKLSRKRKSGTLGLAGMKILAKLEANQLGI